jgi:hypothetical protein
MPAGRPSQLTPEVLEDFRCLLPTCLYLETAAAYIGVSRMTVNNWLRRGSAEEKRLRNPRCRPKASEGIYVEFLYAYKKALAEGEVHDLGVIKKASQSGARPISVKRTTKPDGTVVEETRYAAGEWTAAAWRAERRFPERWGRDRALLIELAKHVKELRNGQAPGATQPPAPSA